MGPCLPAEASAKAGEGGGTRTHDLRLKKPLLYQLSYAPISEKHSNKREDSQRRGNPPNPPLEKGGYAGPIGKVGIMLGLFVQFGLCVVVENALFDRRLYDVAVQLPFISHGVKYRNGLL